MASAKLDGFVAVALGSEDALVVNEATGATEVRLDMKSAATQYAEQHTQAHAEHPRTERFVQQMEAANEAHAAEQELDMGE